MKKEKVRQNKRKRADKKKNGRIKQTVKTNGSYGKRKKEKKRTLFSKVEPWKVILGAVIIGALGVLYLNHVFATQELLREVQQLAREYNQVKRLHSDYKLNYDRMIGPAEIYEKAQNMGFINGGPAEKVIEVKK
jgi:cell division protein FtsL